MWLLILSRALAVFNPEVTEVGRPLNIRCVWAGLRLTMKSYRVEYCLDGITDPNYVGACKGKILSRKYGGNS